MPERHDSKIDDSMRKLELCLSGGLEHRRWHFVVHPETGPEAVLFFMDAEYDLVRVTGDMEGIISVHADGNEWLAFDAQQLRWLARKSGELARRMEKYRSVGDAEIDAGWGAYQEVFGEDA